MNNFALAVLIAGVVIFTNKVFYIATVHGPWDAWAIWNLNAKYLASADHWRNMFLNTRFTHPDYPLALPASIAFFTRLFGGTFNELLPFAIHFLITLCIPLLIFTETYKRGIIIASATLLWIATNDFYLTQGTYQLADTLLAFFLLCAMVCMQHHRDDSRMLVMCAAFLGCCMWTKNEGVIIVAIFAAFHMHELLGKFRFRYTLYGIAAPLLVWLIFKIFFATANDMVSAQGGNTWRLIGDAHRYKLIYDSFIANMNEHFKLFKWLTVLYLLYCAVRKRMPDKRLLMLLSILIAYLLIYVVSPNDLEWHLHTSLSRLIHQLMPAFLYVFATKLAGNGGTNVSGFRAKFVSVRQRLQ